MTLAESLRMTAKVFHKNDGFEADLLLLAASTIEKALRSLALDPINEATYSDLILLLEKGAK